jgi:hypothetical protein
MGVMSATQPEVAETGGDQCSGYLAAKMLRERSRPASGKPVQFDKILRKDAHGDLL